jgi:sulfur-carrier protein
MAQVRLFASMREAAGRSHDEVPGATVAAVLDAAVERYGADFAARLPQCRVWVNGEPVDPDSPVGDEDEVAVLPPVSGG